MTIYPQDPATVFLFDSFTLANSGGLQSATIYLGELASLYIFILCLLSFFQHYQVKNAKGESWQTYQDRWEKQKPAKRGQS